ncbi:MAG TPA: DNA polymerase Y family protein [Acidimicrobiia bacterium]|nr:DNA polymerase Y family protein [Acidimicrobiia bacterium]
MRAPAERTLCCWCPDWPVATARRRDPGLAGAPVAVVGSGDPGSRPSRGPVVCAASAEARAEGVVVGLRRREAEARCPGLVVLDADPAAEARAFEAVARATEPITPRIELVRPGLLSFPTRGPSRYFGGDAALARRVLEAVAGVGVVDARVGVADGAFAARLAARRATDEPCVVAPGASAAFLADWPVETLAPTFEGGADFAHLLVRLGLHTLGAFAALPAGAVLTRFGPDGARVHRLACGHDDEVAVLVAPPPELVETCELDPPATRVDEAAFAAKGLADRLLARLDESGLSCTQVVIEAETEHGERVSRCWRHEGVLTPTALVARVRWQLEAWLTSSTRPGEDDEGRVDDATGGLVLVRVLPDRVVPATGRQLGFWGGDAAAGDRADRALARLQGMLGHDAVVTGVVAGGRSPVERIRWVPWGEPRDPGPAGVEAPGWPGAVPGPAPARVHDPPVPAALLDAAGRPVVVSGRGEASAPPARLECAALPEGGGPVLAWVGPWPHDLRWWDLPTRRRRALWQVVVGRATDTGVACLVAVEQGTASVEAVYD